MSYQFSVDEILQMAEQIERNGARFYRSAYFEDSGTPAGRISLAFS